MHAIFSRRVVVAGSSLQLTKPGKRKTSQSRHFLSHLLPYGLSSSSSATRFVHSVVPRSEKIHGFFASTLGNTQLKQKFGNVFESRVRFFSSELPPSYGFESKGFAGFQKRGWKFWINGANGVVFGLIIANAAVFTMWRVSDRAWMAKNFVLSRYSFMTGRIHTLITSGFSHIGTSQIIMNMIGLYYFGTRIARTLGPLYLLKLYFAGALGSSVFFLSNHALLATLKTHMFIFESGVRHRIGCSTFWLCPWFGPAFVFAGVVCYFEFGLDQFSGFQIFWRFSISDFLESFLSFGSALASSASLEKVVGANQFSSSDFVSLVL